MKKLLLPVLALLSAAAAHADITHESQAVCNGDQITLTASTTGDSYEWSNGEKTKSITVKPTTATSYTCKVTTTGESGFDNRLSLGSFEFPPRDGADQMTDPQTPSITYNFRNHFDKNGVDINIGDVTTATNANNVKPLYFSRLDPQDGNYLLVCDGGNDANARVWEARDVASSGNPLKQGTTYEFGCYAANIDLEYAQHGDTSLAQLKFVIETQEGVDTLSKFTVSEELGKWEYFKGTYTPNSDCSWAHIYLVNFTTAQEGNDFALDNVYFGNEKTSTTTVTETFPVTVETAPTVTITNNSFNPCAGASVTISATAANYASLSWTKNEQAASELSGASISVTAAATAGTTDTYVITAAGTKCPSASASATVTSKDCNVNVTISQTNNTVCEPTTENPCNGSATATASGGSSPYTYLWTTGATSASISNLCSGTYGVTVTDANGTTTEGSVTITTSGTVTVNEGTATICEGNSYEFHGQTFTEAGPMTVSVPQEDGCTYIYNAQLSYFTVVPEYVSDTICSGESYSFHGNEYTEAGSYTVDITDDNGCTTQSTLTLSVTSFDSVSISGDDDICPGKQASVSLSGIPDGTAISWTGGEAEGSTLSHISVMPEATTTYAATLTNGSCTAQFEFVVTVNPLPSLSAEVVTGESDSEIKITATGGTEPYTYVLDNTTSSTTGVFAGAGKGYHNAKVTDAKGCEADTTVFVTINIVPDKYFTPNGDGVNDVWTIKNISLVPSRVYIYDRNGRQMAKYDGDFEGWDGYYNGHVMPSDDYWYVVEEKATGLTQTGHFTLHRGK